MFSFRRFSALFLSEFSIPLSSLIESAIFPMMLTRLNAKKFQKLTNFRFKHFAQVQANSSAI